MRCQGERDRGLLPHHLTSHTDSLLMRGFVVITESYRLGRKGLAGSDMVGWMGGWLMFINAKRRFNSMKFIIAFMCA